MSSARSAKKKSPVSARSTKKGTTKKSPAKAATKQSAPKKTSSRKSGVKKNTGVSKTSESGEVESELVSICRQLAEVVELHTLSELVVDTPELNLIIRRGGIQSEGIPMMTHPLAAPAAGVVIPVAATSPTSAVSLPPEVDETLHTVTSPFVGTFYRSPNPDSSSYCEVGQRVEKGQVLCIVEAMKLMNEIEADIGGTLEAVLVDNAEPVEYGQSLFTIKP